MKDLKNNVKQFIKHTLKQFQHIMQNLGPLRGGGGGGTKSNQQNILKKIRVRVKLSLCLPN
jgi:hypothetical protein